MTSTNSMVEFSKFATRELHDETWHKWSGNRVPVKMVLKKGRSCWNFKLRENAPLCKASMVGFTVGNSCRFVGERPSWERFEKYCLGLSLPFCSCRISSSQASGKSEVMFEVLYTNNNPCTCQIFETCPA